MKMKNKQGIMSIIIIAIIVLVSLFLFIILQINPFGAFAKIKNFVNYILIILIWITVQVGMVAGYYYLGRYVMKGYNLYKSKFQKVIISAKRFLIMRG